MLPGQHRKQRAAGINNSGNPGTLSLPLSYPGSPAALFFTVLCCYLLLFDS
jgi:hypothetical protein